MRYSPRGPATLTTEQRFWRKVAPADALDCWQWTAARDRHGYGKFHSPETGEAHRYAWLLLRGEIPEGLVLDHLCRNPGCVNPWHLEPVTVAENFRRGLTGVLRTACKAGHPFDEANTYWYRGYRKCRECNRATQERHRQRRAAA